MLLAKQKAVGFARSILPARQKRTGFESQDDTIFVSVCQLVELLLNLEYGAD